MKKTILLTSLLASVASIAATSGSVEFYNKNETLYYKGDNFNDNFKETTTTTGVKTEVKVKETGLSFGADVKVKELDIFNGKTSDQVLTNIKDNSSVWAKYDLPEMNNINSYVKAKYETVGKINVEGDLSYKLAEKLSAGLNSVTEFDFSKGALTSDKVTSVHKAYLKGEYDKVKDIYAELGVTHDYKTDKAAKNVFLNAKASYEATKDLTISGKIDFVHGLNGNGIDKKSLLFNGFETLSDNKLKDRYMHSYLLSVKYTGVKDTELKLDAFIEHNRIDDKQSNLNFGFKPEITYKGIENLVLSSKNVLGGTTNYVFAIPGMKPYTMGIMKLNANAEYTYKVTDKFNVKPSLDLTTEILVYPKENNIPSITWPALFITPKLAAEYKPSENLTISGDIAPKFTFGLPTVDQIKANILKNGIPTFGYIATDVKSSINVKYTW